MRPVRLTILIDWDDPERMGTVNGSPVAGGTYTSAYDPTDSTIHTQVHITLSTVNDGSEFRGYGDYPSITFVFMHELGHAMGVGHSIGYVDLMSYAGGQARVNDDIWYDQPIGYGPGDLVGLKAVGYTGRC